MAPRGGVSLRLSDDMSLPFDDDDFEEEEDLGGDTREGDEVSLLLLLLLLAVLPLLTSLPLPLLLLPVPSLFSTEVNSGVGVAKTVSSLALEFCVEEV